MKDKASEKQIAAILKALDDAIENGPWDESNFLRVIGKDLRAIREKYANQQTAPTLEQSKITARLADRIALHVGQQEIFIALYSSEGSKLSSWERILANLPKQIISRPVYADEQDISELMRTKENKVNEAYVSIYINKNDILLLPQDKTPSDKLGKPLLSLKNKSLDLENINRFVHESGEYTYVHGRLIKNTSTVNKP